MRILVIGMCRDDSSNFLLKFECFVTQKSTRTHFHGILFGVLNPISSFPPPSCSVSVFFFCVQMQQVSMEMCLTKRDNKCEMYNLDNLQIEEDENLMVSYLYLLYFFMMLTLK